MSNYRIVANPPHYEVIYKTSFSTYLFDYYQQALAFIQAMEAIMRRPTNEK